MRRCCSTRRLRAGGLAVIADKGDVRAPDSSWSEVKAATETQATHLADAAFQALVLQRAKIPVGRVLLGLVNNQFVLRRVGDYQGLLLEVDITESVQGYLAEAAARALEFQDIMASDSMPGVAVGPHCLSPAPVCPYMSRCTADHATPDYPVDAAARRQSRGRAAG